MSEKVLVMGIAIEKYEKCIWCKEKTSVFGIWGYTQPCDKCRDTEKYDKFRKKENERQEKIKSNMGMDEALNANKPAAIWEGRGRQVITNSKGNIIDNVPYKRRPLGRKGTKI